MLMHPRIYQEVDSNILEVRYQFYYIYIYIYFNYQKNKKIKNKGLLTIHWGIDLKDVLEESG